MDKTWANTSFSCGRLHRHENACDRNAWSVALSASLTQLIKKDLRKGHYVCALVMGCPHSLPFCAGGNLSEYKKKPRAQVLKTHRDIASALSFMTKQKILTIACVGGDVWGGGWEILSSFDYVLSYPEARFHFQQMKWGVGPGWGGGKRILEKAPPLGPVLLKGSVLDAQELYHLGLIHELLPANYFYEDAHLAKALESRFEHLEGLELKSWQKLILALREKKTLLERQAFESLWGHGRHQRLYQEWISRK